MGQLKWKSFVKQNADRWHGAYIQKTTLPYEDNYLDLDPTVKDPLGVPVCRITADFKDNERESRRVRRRQDGAVVSRGGRHGHRETADGNDGTINARLRRHANGRQRRNERREPMGICP